jgi:hypothetical protein
MSLCLTIKHYTVKTRGEVDVETDVFLTSALDGGERLASWPGRFTPRERAPSTIGWSPEQAWITWKRENS